MTSLAVAMVAGALAVPAQAKKAKSKPVATTLYMHGASQLGEMDSDGVVNAGYLPMDATKPSGSTPKSKQITNYVVGPNAICAGNALFPTWTGHLTGHVVGDLKVSLYTAGTPSAVDVRIWPDVSSLLCDQETLGTHDYIQPAAHQVVTLPPGEGLTTITIKDVNFVAAEGLMIQVTPDAPVSYQDPTGANHTLLTPSLDRVLYDASGFETSVSFNCIPAPGAGDCIS